MTDRRRWPVVISPRTKNEPVIKLRTQVRCSAPWSIYEGLIGHVVEVTTHPRANPALRLMHYVRFGDERPVGFGLDQLIYLEILD